MSKVFTGKEFVSALSQGALKEAITIVGMVKHDAEHATALRLAPGSCASWISIPSSMIEAAEHLGTSRCHDHEHALARITLKEPEPGNEQARVFGALLRAGMPAAQSGGAGASAMPHAMASIAPGGASGPGLPPGGASTIQPLQQPGGPVSDCPCLTGHWEVVTRWAIFGAGLHKVPIVEAIWVCDVYDCRPG